MTRPTLVDVAARAGVSRATASRVLNGSTSVDARLAKRVNAAVRDLNYVPNQAARALMTQRTNTIALVAAESDTRVFGDPFFSGITRGVSQEVSAARRQLTLFMSQGDDELEDVASYLLAGHCDGVLLISQHGHHRIAAELTEAGIPVVIGGRPFDPAMHAPYVDNDNVGGGHLAAQHLRVDRGRRRIATIAGPEDMSAGIDRLVGFTRGLGPDADPDLVARGEFTSASGAAAMADLLDREPDIDGVFAASDLMAIGALSVLHRRGRRVPEDVSLVGFDDILLASETTPALTTVQQDTVEQGRRMARLLRDIIEERPSSNRQGDGAGRGGVVLPVDLVVRDSS